MTVMNGGNGWRRVGRGPLALAAGGVVLGLLGLILPADQLTTLAGPGSPPVSAAQAVQICSSPLGLLGQAGSAQGQALCAQASAFVGWGHGLLIVGLLLLAAAAAWAQARWTRGGGAA